MIQWTTSSEESDAQLPAHESSAPTRSASRSENAESCSQSEYSLLLRLSALSARDGGCTNRLTVKLRGDGREKLLREFGRWRGEVNRSESDSMALDNDLFVNVSPRWDAA